MEFGTLGEIFIILCATLILLGPREIPTVLRALGRVIYKFRKISRLVQNQINPYIFEGEVESFKQENNLYADGETQHQTVKLTTSRKALKTQKKQIQKKR